MADNETMDPSPSSSTVVPGATRPPTPRWVKIFMVLGLIALVLILGVVVANMAGFGGEHGPGRHFGGGSDMTHPPGSNHTQPSEHHTLPNDEATMGNVVL